MHPTRHDTCGKFCWVTKQTLTRDQVQRLQHVISIHFGEIPDTHKLRVACGQAFNVYALSSYYIREAKHACATVINHAKHHSRNRAGT
jgi:hypothetical protein